MPYIDIINMYNHSLLQKIKKYNTWHCDLWLSVYLQNIAIACNNHWLIHIICTLLFILFNFIMFLIKILLILVNNFVWCFIAMFISIWPCYTKIEMVKSFIVSSVHLSNLARWFPDLLKQEIAPKRTIHLYLEYSRR